MIRYLDGSHPETAYMDNPRIGGPRRDGRLEPLAKTLAAVFRRLRLQSACNFTPETSELEQELFDTLARHSNSKWYQQVEIKTAFATFYLDMGSLIRPGRAVGIECDGRESHTDKLRDFCRDALILGTGRVACIYRLEAWAVRKRQMDWLRILSGLEPTLLTDCSIKAIRGLSPMYDLVVRDKAKHRHFGFLSRLVPQEKSVQNFLEFAHANQSLSFRELVETYRSAIR